ncbi:hypothetical protein ES703_68794 [subsurface metagenome]
MKNHKIINGNCWVAYFDVVGFKALVKDYISYNGTGSLNIFADLWYKDIVNKVRQLVIKQESLNSELKGKIGFCYFSDTFIFYIPEDQPNKYRNFVTIDSIIRLFFIDLLSDGFFFKGALSFGDFYAGTSEGIYIGPALIDAYKNAEKIDWPAGFVVSDIVVDKLKGTELDLDNSLDYAKYGVSVKEYDLDALKIRKKKENLFAYRIAKYKYIEEVIMEKQKEAEVKYPDKYKKILKQRYDELLEFIKSTKLNNVNKSLCSLWLKIKKIIMAFVAKIKRNICGERKQQVPRLRSG